MECFICFEEKDTIQIQEIQYLYFTSCICNANVHENCFTKWINVKPQCPLCRKPYILKTNIYSQIIPQFRVCFCKCFVVYCYFLMMFWTIKLWNDISREFQYDHDSIHDSSYYEKRD